MKRRILKIGAILLILVGIALACYPWISEYLYEKQVDTILTDYQEEVEEIDNSEVEEAIRLAQEYNENLQRANVTLTDPFTEQITSASELDYYSILNQSESGIMAFVDIPKIDVYLPIYHGTTAETLEKGIGHLEMTSFPVGGTGTHAVISGHTGLNSAKMFTDLTALEVGDLFFIHVFSETLAYRVCDINVVLPEDTSLLSIQSERDLVTLVTCTPYGVNSHRLLVTGERTEYTEEVQEEAEEQVTISGETEWMTAYKKAILIGLGAAFVVIVICVCIDRFVVRRKQYRRW